MGRRLYGFLNKLYTIIMMTAFFAGGLPVIPFVVALIIGGEFGEKVSVFLLKNIYPWVSLLASISILIGLVALYISKSHGFSEKELKSTEIVNKE